MPLSPPPHPLAAHSPLDTHTPTPRARTRKQGFVDTYLATFTMFDGLWRLSKQEAFEVFLQTEPTLHDYEGELRRYHKLEQDIASIPDIYSIGALAFDARPLKEALLIETGQWKQFYGVNLKSKSQKEMRFVLEFVDETVQRLGREVKDLDDIKVCSRVVNGSEGCVGCLPSVLGCFVCLFVFFLGRQEGLCTCIVFAQHW